MVTNGLVVGCVICQLTAASNGVEISLLCVIVKLLMGFNCERWTDDMGDLRIFSFHYPSGSLQSHNQFSTSIAHLSTANSASENTIPTTTTTTTTTTTVNNIPSVCKCADDDLNKKKAGGEALFAKNLLLSGMFFHSTSKQISSQLTYFSQSKRKILNKQNDAFLNLAPSSILRSCPALCLFNIRIHYNSGDDGKFTVCCYLSVINKQQHFIF
ncbi:hypothetical protein T02_6123 [Trichinella nativa]|uniref:Uncharacterized protein n=1 Tax=Trichinella nativa TaxID=6335 RepID=A0A0V1KVI5_9BILA|nr:hypothetical protein T02_6123 [Trichinella nativa]